MLYRREYSSVDREGRLVGKQRLVAIQRGAGILHPTGTTKVTAYTPRTKKLGKSCQDLQKPCLELPNPAKIIAQNLH